MLAANRTNAARSSGPRTERGKRVSALNALRHGYYSRAATTAEPGSKREAEAFAAFELALGVAMSVADTEFARGYLRARALELWKVKRVARPLAAAESVPAPARPTCAPAGAATAAAVDPADRAAQRGELPGLAGQGFNSIAPGSQSGPACAARRRLRLGAGGLARVAGAGTETNGRGQFAGAGTRDCGEDFEGPDGHSSTGQMKPESLTKTELCKM